MGNEASQEHRDSEGEAPPVTHGLPPPKRFHNVKHFRGRGRGRRHGGRGHGPVAGGGPAHAEPPTGTEEPPPAEPSPPPEEPAPAEPSPPPEEPAPAEPPPPAEEPAPAEPSPPPEEPAPAEPSPPEEEPEPSEQPPIEDEPPPPPEIKLKPGFTRDEFYAARSTNTVEGALNALSMLARRCDSIPNPAKAPAGTIEVSPWTLFIVVNTYTKPKYQLGSGPLNDSLTVAYDLLSIGYDVLFLHNATTTQFKYWIKFLFDKVTESFVLYYTGHGASVKDKSGDEADGCDEVLLFENTYVLDDELASILRSYRNPVVKKNPNARTVLLADCCHSGTIWDLPNDPKKIALFPKGVLGLSAALDHQTAKQLTMDKKDQGLFTYYFWKFWEENPEITPNQMKARMEPFLKKFSQEVVISVTCPELADQPIFPDPPD